MTRFPAVLLSLRIGWLVVGLVGAAVLGAALDGRSTAVIATAALIAAIAWGAGVVAVLLPRSTSLTVLRLLGVGFLLPAGLVDEFVDGSSYGPERRFSLRTPVPLLLGPVELAWLAVVVPAIVGPLLLAARQWVAGVLVLAAGAVATRWSVRSLHLLARRWLVFVPAGLVVHDPMVLTDAVLFPKRMVASIGPALADAADGALDVTGAAPGLVLELRLVEPAPIGVIAGRRAGGTFEADRLLVTPARPGAVLAEASDRSFQTAMPPPTTSSPS